MLGKIMCACGLLLLAGMVAAQPIQPQDRTDAAEAGRALGQGFSVTGTISNGPSAATVPGYGGDSPSQSGLYQGGYTSNVGVGTQQILGCQGGTSIECQAIELVEDGKDSRPQFSLSEDDPIFQQVDVGSVGDLIEEYETCISTEITSPALFETQICNEYAANEEELCGVGLIVNVDVDHVYRCLQTIQTEQNRTCTIGRVIRINNSYTYRCTKTTKQLSTYTCDRYLNVNCLGGGDGCEPAGLNPSTIQADMKTSLTHLGGGTYQLQFGLQANNYWSSPNRFFSATIYDRELRFTIDNKEQISEFYFERAEFDDWVMVKLNGKTVFIGPHTRGNRQQHSTWTDGRVSCYEVGTYCMDRIEVVYEGEGLPYAKVQYGPNPWDRDMAELDTSWVAWPGLDLRPYLVNGQNVLTMRTIVSGNGEGAIWLNLRKMCPATCTDEWVNGCTYLESQS